MGQLGVQLTPWTGSRQLMALARRLAGVVDIMWVQDQMLARNVYALLGAIAAAGCGVGTNVTFPSRPPTTPASRPCGARSAASGDQESGLGRPRIESRSRSLAAPFPGASGAGTRLMRQLSGRSW